MLMRQNHLNRQTKRPGFTLMEIIVVVAIILILASAGVVVYTTLLAGTKEDRAKMDCKSLQTVVTSYYVKHTVYPQSLRELTERQQDGTPAMLEEKGLIDPWGNEYLYDPNQRHPKTDRPLIYTNGPPGQNKKISNWD
jgi:general secretion pathway protein G